MLPVITRCPIHSLVLALRMVCGLTASLLSGSGLASGSEGAAAATVRKTGAKNPAVVWESLPAIRTGVKIRSHTSKSALNCTIMDWTNYTLQDGNGYEQAFVKGCSGMLIHSWFAWLNAPEGNLKLYLKDAVTPACDMPITDYFKAGKPPHLLWYNQDGCIWSAFPCLPFDSVFKAAITKRPDWYQYTLHLYREGRFSEALTPEEVEALKTRVISPGGAFPGADPGNLIESRMVELGAAQAVAVFETSKAGVIRSIRIVPPAAAGAMDSISIRMTTDGTITADLPISMFFGGYKEIDMRNARGLPAGFDGKQLYCYFPMPFWKSLKIELVNKQTGPVQAACEVGWSDHNPYPEDSTGIFKVQFNDNVLNYEHAPYKELVKNYFDQKKEQVPSWQNGTMPSKFRDTEFEIPAALTKGKKKLDIKMVTRNSLAVNPSDEKLTNEYYYWIYSYASAGSTQ